MQANSGIEDSMMVTGLRMTTDSQFTANRNPSNYHNETNSSQMRSSAGIEPI